MKCALGVGLLLTGTLLFGCSDERESIPEAGRPDAAVETAVRDAALAADVSIDVPTADGYIDLFDVFPLPDGGCPGCIRDRCGTQINACINNPACAAGLFCTLQMCAGGLVGEGGFNPSSFTCVLGCFNGDQNLAIMAISSLTCVTMTCGAACNFLDAGSDVRREPDVSTPPDASIDAAPEDAGAEAATPETGPGTDAADDTDGEGGPQDDDAAADDAPSDTGGEVDTGSPMDATEDTDPPGDDGGVALPRQFLAIPDHDHPFRPYGH